MCELQEQTIKIIYSQDESKLTKDLIPSIKRRKDVRTIKNNLQSVILKMK